MNWKNHQRGHFIIKAICSVFAIMFGYTVKPEWVRVVAHAAYLAIALPLVVWVCRKEVTQGEGEDTIIE